MHSAKAYEVDMFPFFCYLLTLQRRGGGRRSRDFGHFSWCLNISRMTGTFPRLPHRAPISQTTIKVLENFQEI